MMIVTFGRGVIARAIKTQFLVVDCSSLYQCIFGRPSLAELIMVLSTVHLKMKYYTTEDLVTTLHGTSKRQGDVSKPRPKVSVPSMFSLE